uniref:HDC08156 n=1 Tax=Drosophila melanogaster TaxID=7227 RepID=Q6ILX5_DROME|nr:TPA_inf: HDC08156 [Drosophila melanogaster]
MVRHLAASHSYISSPKLCRQMPLSVNIVFGADGQPVRPDSKRGRGKGKSSGSGNGTVNATGIAAGNGTPTTGLSSLWLITHVTLCGVESGMEWHPHAIRLSQRFVWQVACGNICVWRRVSSNGALIMSSQRLRLLLGDSPRWHT